MGRTEERSSRIYQGETMNTLNGDRASRMSRRSFLAGTSAWGLASLLGVPRTAAAEPPPEMTTIRLVHSPAICLSPQYLAEELLRMEGFVQIAYIDEPMNKSLSPLEIGHADM